jgi:hypothetical protein
VKRILKVLAVVALVAVLMATSVSPAFAQQRVQVAAGDPDTAEGFANDYGCKQHHVKDKHPDCGWHGDFDKGPG